MQQKKRVVFYLLDGARPDVLQKLIEQKHLPHLARIIDEGTFRVATTCLPSTTGPAYLPFLTGHFPGTMNITGIRWFDKKEFKRKRINKLAMRSYCGPEASFFNSDMAPEKPTLFEAIDKAYNVYNMVTRGVKKEHDITPANKGMLYTRAHFFKRHHPVDKKGHAQIMSMLTKKQDFDFVFAVFPSVDWDSHYYHFEDERTIAAYKIADESIGELRHELEKKGWWQNTLFLLTSDHGLTATHSHFDIGDWLTENDLKALSYPVIWRRQPRSAVMISGNSFGSVNLLNHMGDHFLHKRQLSETMGEERLQLFTQQTAVAFIVYRDTEDKSYEVRNADGTATVSKKGNQFYYQPQTADPLRLGGEFRFENHREVLEGTMDSEYPDALVQINQLFRSRRAGDFIINASDGHDLRGFWEYPEHKGSHGSLAKAHMQVPLIYNRKGWTSQPARTADLFATILKWLDKPVTASEGDALF